MTWGMGISLAGWSIFVVVLGIFLFALFREDNGRMENSRMWNRIFSIGLVGGLLLMAVGSVTMALELNSRTEVYVECVADQSALAGVCVPVDQAG